MKTLNRVLSRAPQSATNARAIIYEQMADGEWYTLRDLAFIAGCSEAATSARIRDLRKSQYGGYTIEAKPTYGSTVWVYRLVS